MRQVVGAVCAVSVLLGAAAGVRAGEAWYGGIQPGGGNGKIDGGASAPGAAPFGLSAERREPGLKVLLGYRFSPKFSIESGFSPAEVSRAWVPGPLPGAASPGAVPGPGGTVKDVVNPKYGLGLQYDIGKSATLRGEWGRYRSFGGWPTGESETGRYSIGLRLRF